MTSQPADKPTHPTWRTRTSSVLTALAHGSAPFITTFLFVHLAAPAAANLGGSSASSRTMLFGREYYQTVLGERYLVFTPLLVHTTSAFLKRLFSPSAPRPPATRPLTSALSVTGYTVALLLLPVHFYAHRLAPSDPAPPISSLGPSELDYEYVKAALHGWPARSTALYLALVLGVALHAADGVGVLWSTWVQKKAKRLPPGRRARRALAGAAALPVLTGLAIIAREPLFAFASMAERYRVALTRSFVYRLY